ncbi:MAG: acyl-ACP--UDP-N-acetylglucosamine O-acyltransferase [Candidatus Omnitrophica bacterium]|nr:acyl-ACP--UDP-N-acetylglucosamine O-acyltransferase [Candidatus Omnitrophota bacterium]
MAIHPTAIVSKTAELGEGVEVGPYAVIGPHVKIGAGTRVLSHAVLDGHTTIGARCEIFTGACLGMPAQDKKFKGETSFLSVGDENVIREYVTMHCASTPGAATVVGSRNFIMVGAHVGHDCRVGDEVTMANGSVLGGYVVVEDGAVLGGFTGVHQYVRVGRLAMLGAFAKAAMDVPPFSLCDGYPARVCGLNSVGLRRAGYAPADSLLLKKSGQDTFYVPALVVPRRRKSPKRTQTLGGRRVSPGVRVPVKTRRRTGAAPPPADKARSGTGGVTAEMWGGSRDSGGPIGLIAGTGDFPALFAEAAASLKKEVFVIGFHGYTDKRIENFSRQSLYLDLGAVGKIAEALKGWGVRRVAFAGGIPKRQIYDPSVSLDGAARAIIQGTGNRGDDHLLKAFVLYLGSACGVAVVDSRLFLKDILADKGVMTGRRPTAIEKSDLSFGWKIAKGIGRMDIGQTVVVKEGNVLAVEALEGTDAAIRRAGELGGGGGVVVKTAKPGQDLRFDLPCIGLGTLGSMKSAGCRVIGVEAGKTLMLHKNRLIEEADAGRMSLVGL